MSAIPFPLARLAVPLAVTVAFGAPALAQAPDLRPGLWELEIAGAPQARQTVCLSAERVRDMKNLAAQADASSDCRAVDERAAGATRTFRVICTRPQKFEATVTVTVHGPDNFSLSQDFKAEHAGRSTSGTVSFAYRRLGDCPQ